MVAPHRRLRTLRRQVKLQFEQRRKRLSIVRSVGSAKIHNKAAVKLGDARNQKNHGSPPDSTKVVLDTLHSGVQEDNDAGKAVTHETSAVWLPEALVDSLARLGIPPPSSVSSTDPAMEMRRMRSIKSLRHKMRTLCSRHGVYVPLLAFERWHARAMLHEQWQSHGDSIPVKPLLPDCAGWVDRGLVKDLKRARMEEYAAESIAESMTASSSSSARALEASPKEERKLGVVHVVFKRHQIDFSLGHNGKPYLTLNKSHYDKLKMLHDHYQKIGNGSLDERLLHDRIFCILACMEALQGAGYQAALPPSTFRLLRERLGVSLECFASPLNCTLPCYCSLLPHVDAPFGSRGSFFALRVDCGSFEMNPPFVPEVMTAAVRHAEDLLENSCGPMSFAIFVPAWREVACWDQLQKSKWRQGDIEILAASDHVFSDGAQHRAASQFRPASFDTAVAFLQNPSGAKRWPVTKLFLDELRTSVSATGERLVPNLQSWEHRGSAKGGRQASGSGWGGIQKRRGGNWQDGAGQKSWKKSRYWD